MPLIFLRQASTIERFGRWFLLTVLLSAGFALLGADRPALMAAPQSAALWTALVAQWTHLLAGTAVVTGALIIVPRWLPEDRLRRWPLLAVTAGVAAAIGFLVQEKVGALVAGRPIAGRWEAVYAHSFIVLSILIAVLSELRRLDREAAAAVHGSEVKRLGLKDEIAASRLQVLQAQVEPHFIFNSLANVRRLLRIDGPAGRAMLEDMLRYLQTALPRLRDEEPTLGNEIEISRALLAVHQVRMGSRLRVEIDIGPGLLDVVVPPMMLLTLIENALKHGLHPRTEGGTIRIVAKDDRHGALILSVADDGCGLAAGTGPGTGLANIRARLSAMYGTRAALTLAVNEPRGVMATLVIPGAHHR